MKTKYLDVVFFLLFPILYPLGWVIGRAKERGIIGTPRQKSRAHPLEKEKFKE